MNLNQEQQCAVEYLSGPLLVLAGPGTGKTQLLSAKVTYILKETDASPENILCVTFTDAGASNMRERLRSMVGRAADEVNIYTYHTFGKNLLARYRNYAETGARQIDDAIDEVTQYKILHKIQTELPVDDILKDTDIKLITDTIKNAKDARYSSEDLRKVAERNLADSAELGRAVTDILKNLQKGARFPAALEQTYEPLLEVLTEHIEQTEIVHGIEPIANILTRELANVIKTEREKPKPSAKALTDWKNKHFENAADGTYRLQDYIANKKLLSVAHIMEVYEQELHAANLLDFSDMIQEAIRALQNDEGFRLSMSERFQYILLDEFQDTNPSQFELIKLITQYDRPIIMAVGDDDQAIYEFQGANASNLLEFQSHYHAKVITLLDNYRSTGKILDFSHQVAAQIEDSFAKQHNIQKLLRSIRDTSTPTTKDMRIERHEFSVAEQEYHWVANEIKRLIDEGEAPDNVAIIAPKHKYIAPILPHLKACDINIAYEKRTDIFEDEKMKQIITLAEFLNQLAQEQQLTHHLLEVLSYEFWTINPVVVLRAAQNARRSGQTTLDFLAESEDESLQQIATMLAELVVLSFDTPLELWLDYLTGKQPLPRSELVMPYMEYYGEQLSDIEKLEFYKNLVTLRDTVNNHLGESKPKLNDLAQTISDYREAGSTIQCVTMYRDASQAVQVMSAHKSKGLEYKYVFLIAVDDWAWGKSKGNNNHLVLPANVSQIRHTGATNDERLRLFFVAITRAKNCLIMTNSHEDFSGKQVKRLNYLDERSGETPQEEISPFLPAGMQQIQVHDDTDVRAALEANERTWTAAYQVMQPDLELMLRSSLERYRLNATDLAGFIDIQYSGPDQFYQHKILGANNESTTPKMAYGNIMHHALEQITNRGVSAEEALQALEEKADSQSLPAHDIEELKQRGKIGLQATLAAFDNILRAEGSKGEVNFSAEHLVYDGVPVTGKIDHLNIDQANKTITIYDFKTGNFKEGGWSKTGTLYKYTLQLEFYKLLLQLSPTYRNYKINDEAYILFVSPDQEGIVHRKPYSYSENSAAEFRKLVKVVYRLMTTLDFVKDPELNITANVEYGIKDIKDFVNKLLTLA